MLKSKKMKSYKMFFTSLLSGLLLAVMACGGGSQEIVLPTSQAQEQLAKVVEEPSSTLTATSTAVPTAPPANTPASLIHPTNTSIPDAPAKQPTSTEVPHTATSIPTATSVPPTSTPTQVQPTPTPTPIRNLTSSEAHCSDEGTHIYCLSSELPAPPEDPNVAWGAITGYSPEVFCASDVSLQLCGWQTSSLLAAMVEWGNYGPLEYWVVGTGQAATEDLTKLNCERRLARRQWNDCHQYREALEQANRFEKMRKTGADAIATGNPSNDMGRNGHRSWGIHFYTSSLPMGWSDLFEEPGGENQKISFHEYFHAIQHAHIQTKDHYKRYRVVDTSGPVWFVEGGAEYMAWVGLLNAYESGVLEEINMEGKDSFYPFNYMKWAIIRGVKDRKSVCPGVPIENFDYQSDCRQAAYDLGAWAHAYLANKFGPDVLLEIFYPNLDKLGWKGAFSLAYGMSPEEFYQEFDEFLDGLLEDQLAILPASLQTTNPDSQAANLNANATAAPTLKPIGGAAKEKLISIRYNVPIVGTVDEARQEYIASLDVPEKYRQRFIEVQENLNSVLGGYPNYIYFAYNRNGTEENAKPVLDRMSDLRPNQEWTIAKLIERQSCLGGANPGGSRTSATNPYSICLENLAFIEHPWGEETKHPYRSYIKMALHLGHEYFHHYQRVHALDRGLDYQTDRDNPETTVQAPTWWIEGAAVAFQNAWFRENWQSLSGLVGLTLDQALSTNIATVASSREYKENRRNILGYGDSEICTPDWYMSSLDETYDTFSGCNASFMATAYLGYLTSYKTVWIDIPQDYYDLGFWGSLEKHAGMSKQEFYDSYNEFLRTGDPDDDPPDGWAPPENYISEYADFLKIMPESN